MKAFLAAVFALWAVQGLAFSELAPAPRQDAQERARTQQETERQARQIEQAMAEHAQAVKDYPAWLIKTIASEFAVVLEAGNNFLAAPSEKNWALFQTAKKEQLQRAGVHICKFDEASQQIGEEERKRLGEQLTTMMDAFAKNENALETKMTGVLAEQRHQEQPVVNR